MTTKLDKPLRREIEIHGEAYTVVISGAGVIITKKRSRTGLDVSWAKLLRLVDEVQ